MDPLSDVLPALLLLALFGEMQLLNRGTHSKRDRSSLHQRCTYVRHHVLFALCVRARLCIFHHLITQGREAARACFDAIDAEITIDNLSETGATPEANEFQASIAFNDVVFSYPMRPTEPILNSVNFTVPAKSTLAIVGSSGSGKSTIISLLERYCWVDPPVCPKKRMRMCF